MPLVQASLVLDAGYAADQFSRPGTSTLTHGHARRRHQPSASALEISEDLALQGASSAPAPAWIPPPCSLSALADKLDPSLEIFADVALDPAFPDKELERLRRINLAGIQQEKNRPRLDGPAGDAESCCTATGHPYAQPLTGSGTEADLAAMTRDDLAAFHATWFRPNHATLIVVGDVKRRSAAAAPGETVRRLAGGRHPGQAADAVRRARSPHALPARPARRGAVGDFRRPAAFRRRTNPDELAIKAMNDVLGGMSSARINMNLREDKHWSYGAYSLILDARGQRPLLAYAPVQTDKTAESHQRNAAGISRHSAATGRRRRTNCSRSSAATRCRCPGRWESGGSVLARATEIVRFGLPDDYWSGYADRVNALGVADVQRSARDLLEPEALAWVVVGDRASSSLAGKTRLRPRFDCSTPTANRYRANAAD